MNYISIIRPELFNITDGVNIYFGGNQEWLPTPWMRRSGCGPCCAGNIFCYLARRKPGFSPLVNLPAVFDKKAYVSHIRKVWEHLHPGSLGINSASMFSEGATNFIKNAGVRAEPVLLDIPMLKERGNMYESFIRFINTGLLTDCPIAFLNLSNGAVQNLYSWHWVTITDLEYSKNEAWAIVSDQGEKKRINLRLWFNTSKLGGGAVYFRIMK